MAVQQLRGARIRQCVFDYLKAKRELNQAVQETLPVGMEITASDRKWTVDAYCTEPDWIGVRDEAGQIQIVSVLVVVNTLNARGS